MGLRGKIVGLFFVCFALMAALSIAMIKTNLAQGFQSIEKKQAVDQMDQLILNLNGELNQLGQLIYDWGNWDDIYNYAKHPTQEFTDHQIALSALKEIDIKWFVILDPDGKTVFSEAVNLTNGTADSATQFDNVLLNVKKSMARHGANGGKTCGLDMSVAGPVLLCWQPIKKSDLTGDPVGTIIMARLLNNALVEKIQARSNIKFRLNPVSVLEAEKTSVQSNKLVAERIEFSKTEPGVLTACLSNLFGQPILKINLYFPKDVSGRGDELVRTVSIVLIIVMTAVGLLMLGGVHYLIVQRLRKMDKELSSIWRNGRWAGRLEAPIRKDEINDLAHLINRMLALIRKQTVMLESIALTDPLTQIANRRAFDERINIEMSMHKRNQTPLSLLIIDLDHFNRYNDLYGHPAGDDILKSIGHLLSHVACRPSDLPARIGGEEFAVILPATDLDGACHVAELFSSKLAELKIAHGDSPVSEYLTACIGVTSAGQEDVAAFMQRADKAMYNAKQTGRNKVCVLQAS